MRERISSGSPCSTTRLASLPGSMLPTVLSTPRTRAASSVSALMAASVIEPPAHSAAGLERHVARELEAAAREGERHAGFGQDARRLVRVGVEVVFTRRQRLDVGQHDGHVVLREEVGRALCVRPGLHHDADVFLFRPRNRVANRLLVAGRDEHRLSLLDDRDERLERQVHRLPRALGVGARALDEGVQLIELTGGAAARAPATPAATAAARIAHRQSGRRAQRGLFPRPAVEVHHRNLSADRAAAGPDADRRDAFDAGHRDRHAVGLVGDPRPQHLAERQDVADVVVVADARLVQPDVRTRVDHARIDAGAGGVHRLGARRHRYARADRLDRVALDDDGALRDRPRRSRERCVRW